jgi:Tol biopolymer transport system component
MIPELASISAGWPSLSADGTVLYFESDDAAANGSLYVVTRPTPADPFGVPRVLAEIADPSVEEGDPFISRDGQTFLFVSARAGGLGLTDVFITTRACR